MDYDENDFQSQNLQLAGEGNSKFPPVLRPYALSKFDFDDNLHGSLRFDSLVETEAFLGIESNEDNQWIEDYSRGGSGIQFSSSAVEPCSISRHNNVWSEATSSESVEMLLKSVGQEEIIPLQTNNKVSDSCDELGCIIKQMDPNLRVNSSTSSCKRDATQPVHALDNIPPENSGFGLVVGEQQPDIGGSSHDIKIEEVSVKALSNLGDTSVNPNLPAEEGSGLIDEEAGNCKVGVVFRESLDAVDHITSTSGLQVDGVVNSEQKVNPKNEELNDEGASIHVSVSAAADCGDRINILNHESQLTDDSIPVVEVVEAATVSHSCLLKSESKVEANITISNLGKEEDLHSTPQKDDSGITESLRTNKSKTIMQKLKMDIAGIVTHEKHEICNLSDPQLVCEKISSQDAASLLAQEVKDDAKVTLSEHCEKSAGNCLTEKSNPAEILITKRSETELLPCVAPNLQVSGKSITLRQDDALQLDKDSPCKETATADLGCDRVNTDGQLSAFISTEGGAGSFPTGEHSIEVGPIPAELNPGTAGEDEPVDSGSATSRNDAQDSIDRRVVDLPESLAVGSVHLDSSKDNPARTAIETSSLDIRSSSQPETGEDGFSGISGQVVILDGAEQELTKESDMSAESEKGNSDDMLRENDGKPPSMESDFCKEMHEPQPSGIQESCHNTGGNSREKDETVLVSRDAGLHNPTSNSSGEKADLVKAVSVLPSETGTSGHPNTGADKVSIKELSDQTDSHINLKDEGAGRDEGISKDTSHLNAPKDAKNFTSQSQDGKKTQSSTEQAITPIMKKSPSTSVSGQSDQNTAQKPSPGSVRVSEVAVSRGRSKGNSERKPRRSATKATGKEAAKKSNPAKESALGQIEKGETTSIIAPNPSATSQILQPAAVFQQPFMDTQQVQLRAQIFVYGALIQGTPPDEAHMVSAFGGPDGGRSIWDKAWRSCMERLHGPKLYPNTPETPLPLSSGSRGSDPATKQGPLDIKVTSTAGQANNKSTPTFLSPMVPFSSPLWSVTTPSAEILQPSSLPRGPVVDFQRAVSPLHHQTTPMRNFVGHNPSWISQPPFCGPWVASPQTSVHDASARSSIPKHSTKPVQLTPAKDSFLQHPSASKHITPGPAAQIGFSGGVVASTAKDANTVSVSSGRPAAETKSRKRKKASVLETPGLLLQSSQPQTDSIHIINQAQSTVTLSPVIGFVSKADAEKSIAFASSTPSTDLRKVNQDAERTILPQEALAKVKEARAQAEEAAAAAAAAVSHSQDMWNQLVKQKNFGLLPDVETRLASAAVAIAAAAAVAKAAAAAANVASNAALQAKLMADEAVGSFSNATQATVSSLSDDMKNYGKATPVSILKGDDGANSSSAILGAARETARRRVEAASAASKQAENMDAIVKAAELAAEAVSQAGKIVAMGDPLPLSELAAAGPDGYWKVTEVTSELVSKSNNVASEIVKIDNTGGADTFAKFSKDVSSNKKVKQITRHGKPPSSKETSSEDNLKLIDVLSGTGAASAKESKGHKGRKPSDSAKTIRVVPESEMVSRTPKNDPGVSKKLVEAVEQQGAIKEGSHVEVFKDSAGLKAAWFCGDVISLNDGKAHVCYDDLMAGEGTEKLKEWVELNPEGDKAPTIRIARPVTALPFEGTRKRRRAAMGDYRWSVGDKVDAWISDSWREGVITEKNKKDDTILTVHFPVHGETVAVKAWHLRTSLVWKDGEWIEWSSLGESSRGPHEGDTPGEKRPRIKSPVVETKKNDKTLKGVDAMESDKPAEPTLLDLTADEKIFNLGKSIKDNKPGTIRMTRTGLQKEGSRVIFGVPKPGKKRKFMEVSKHYVADRSSKSNNANDSFKSAKYLMPQGSSRGLKTSSRPAPNEKAAVLPKSKLGKPQTAFGRTIPQKEHPSSTAVSDPDEKTKAESTSKHNYVESSEEATEGPMLVSSHAPLSSDTLASKNTSSSRSKLERASKGKLAPASGKLGKIEEDNVVGGDSVDSTTVNVEPRRSNRRIQPTSRLLEGLQTSLMVPKLPIISYDKGPRSRTISKRD